MRGRGYAVQRTIDASGQIAVGRQDAQCVIETWSTHDEQFSFLRSRGSPSPLACMVGRNRRDRFRDELRRAGAGGSGGAAPAPSAEELSQLVGPIALYPDDLVAIILPASTNPLQLVQADRYLDKRKADPKLPVDDKWDDAVKSLLNYPDVVKMMSTDLDWTSALGEAVVADQGEVLEAIQSFRRKAQAAGNLKSDGKQVVQVEKEIITIVPADPQVIYVPQYNPSTVVVYGAPVWGYYPTPYPSYYYPYAPGAALAAGVIWGAAIGAAWNGGHYVSHYGGDANININRNTNINTGNINRGGGASQLPAGGSTAWKSNKQPGQVSNSVGKTASSARAGYGSAGGAGAGAGAGRASAQASGAMAAGGGAGRAQSAGSVSVGGSATRTGGSGSAMSGYGSASGRQTQMDSSRGASSRGSMSGSSARSMPSGGGGRAGRRRWARWRRPSLKPGACSCAHFLPSTARYRP